MSIDSGDAPPPPPPPPPPPDHSVADQPVIDEGVAAPESVPSSSVDTAIGEGAETSDVTGVLAPADVPMVDDGQAAPDLPDPAAPSAPDAASPDTSVADDPTDLAPGVGQGLGGPSDLVGASDTQPATADIHQSGGDDTPPSTTDVPPSGGGIPDWTYSPDMGTDHGNESIEGHNGHGVNDGALNDAVQNPETVVDNVDNFGRHATIFNGRDATVVLNDNGQIVTAWPTNRNGYRYP